MLTHIFQFLNVSDCKEVALVNKMWYEATLDPILFKNTIIQLHATSVSRSTPGSMLGFRRNPHLVLKDVNGLTSGILAQWSYRHLCEHLQSLSLRGTEITEGTFINILSHCANLESLDLSGCNSLFMSGQLLSKEDDLLRLRGILVNVTQLNLGSIRYLSDVTFNRITSICGPALKKLSLSGAKALFHSTSYIVDPHDSLGCSSVLTFNNILHFIAQKASSLTALDFSRTTISDEALEAVTKIDELCLKEIRLAHCEEITDLGIKKLCMKQPLLISLDLAQCVGLTNATITAITTHLQGLRYLSLDKCRQVTDYGVGQLHKLGKLEKLQLASCYTVTSEGLVAGLCAATMVRLTHINLSCCSQVGDIFILQLSVKCRNVTHVDLGSCTGVSDVGLHHISKNLIHLRLLNLSWCKRITDYGLLGLLPDDFVHHDESEGLCKCTRRSTIEPGNFGKTDILPVPEYQKLSLGDADYRLSKSRHEYMICNLVFLRDLDLRSCHQLTDVGIIRAIKFCELRSLHLPHNISDESLFALAINLPSLEQLFVPQCKRITDDGVARIARKCRRLTTLNISAIDNITNKALEALMTYATRLKYIDVSLCRNITPQCVDKMECNLNSLQTIHRRYVGGSVDVY